MAGLAKAASALYLYSYFLFGLTISIAVQIIEYSETMNCLRKKKWKEYTSVICTLHDQPFSRINDGIFIFEEYPYGLVTPSLRECHTLRVPIYEI
jgi:hypothetical protein